MKICMVSDDFLPVATGVGTHLQMLIPALVKRGHEVTVLTTRQSGQPAQETIDGVKVFRLRTINFFGFYQAIPTPGEVKTLLKQISPDIIHIHYLGWLLILCHYYARKMRIHEVYTYHMTEVHLSTPLPLRPFRSFFRYLITRFCQHVDHVIFVSKNQMELVLKRGITTPATWISNPVTFAPNTETPPVILSNQFNILFVGRLAIEKNVSFLIRALKILRDNGVQSHLYIAGQGPQRQFLENLIKNLDLTSHVTFLGFLPKKVVGQYYNACDVFVLPSLVESQGLVALEAMYYQKPIIVADSIICATELVSPGINGYIANHKSPHDLAKKLEYLAQNPDLRLKMGRAGKEMVQQITPDFITEQTETYSYTTKNMTKRYGSGL